MCETFAHASTLTIPMHFPYIAASARKFVVPIYPAYHTELLPGSILNTEDEDFEDTKSNRNALSTVYISRSYERDLSAGDIIAFYRTKSPDGPAWYTGNAASPFSFGLIDARSSQRSTAESS